MCYPLALEHYRHSRLETTLTQHQVPNTQQVAIYVLLCTSLHETLTAGKMPF
jgi:hypothetical protein